jgi:hypothetical protein
MTELTQAEIIAKAMCACFIGKDGKNLTDALTDLAEHGLGDPTADPEAPFAGLTSALASLAEATQNIAAMLDMHSCGKPPPVQD